MNDADLDLLRMKFLAVMKHCDERAEIDQIIERINALFDRHEIELYAKSRREDVAMRQRREGERSNAE